ncbi:unnamed protein product [Parascedosporium putredinis]|uniref:SEC7 domain-containing protein n=1 Tax=Parascedosporium putredinis TaxID=1442378 RepID=A0A9P1M9X5_9PEZI|nr:unnamed protein product [Parascedosporium putredinis]CAI7991671.1 unnamed protein product [Parascedosporium putredinis]
MSSLSFVVSSLDAIATSKEAHKNKQLAEFAQAAISAIKETDPQLPDPEIVFAPLQLATKSTSPQLTTTALDCIGKLISYSGRKDPRRRQGALIERAIDTICDCFQGETTPVDVQLQIVKSLLAAVLNDKIVVHGAGLLKAIRQIYNVFLLSRNTANQQIAQGTLTQMVGTVFERVKTRLQMKEARMSLSKLKLHSSNTTFERAESPDDEDDDTVRDGASEKDDDADDDAETEADDNDEEDGADVATTAGEGETKLTLKDLEHRKSFDDTHMGEGPTMVTQLKTMKRTARSVSEQSIAESSAEESPEALDAEDEVYIRDAYLVFRAFCNLATKVLPPDQLYDVRGQAMRSKLVSIHLIHTVLNNHIQVFISPLCRIKNSKSSEFTSFLQAIKYYICLTITRNGACAVDKVFDVTAELFWLMLKFMRAPFKKEIEVFLNEIYLALLARRTAPITQKLYVVNILGRLCADPRALVEIFLNYDCDGSITNIYQTIIEDLSKYSTAPVLITTLHEQAYEEKSARVPSAAEWQVKTILPPPLTVAAIAPLTESEPDIPREYTLKRVALDALVEALRSLVTWSASVRPDASRTPGDADIRQSLEDIRASIDPSIYASDSPQTGISHPGTPVVEDDPEQLEKIKARKTAMTNAVNQFNFKPKRGIKALIQEGFIPSDSPEDIARFLLADERLDKAQIGEYLGEGDQKNIEIMHAFVDQMDFTKKRFVDALRLFLQSFRLPGEAQKIDRFMLKFANRYVMGNPNAFANADTAYVLSYSVIMLNTDLHSGKVARRMTKEDFIKNNRGINDNADLPEEYLIAIYEEIQNNEIVLKSEREAAAAAGTLPVQGSGASLQVSDRRSPTSVAISRRNATKNGTRFIPATSFRHVGSMFDVTWMSYFSALSSQMQKTHNLEVNKLLAFINAIKNTTNLNNPHEIHAKNVEALKVLLDLGQTEGNVLNESWKDILMCISQLDRLQLISGGVDESAVPDVSQARFLPPPKDSDAASIRSKRRSRARSGVSNRFSTEIALESRSDEVIKSVDRIFTNTANLSGDAIVHFARALTELAKIVEISYYNMTRVRFEWTQIWDVLGEHFNKVGCHNNTTIVFFTLDSLRQLSMRFMEIEELPGFKFQKDFLKPFEHVLSNSHNVAVKDMVLRCLIQMILAKGDNIRSGWRTMFGVFTVAAREPYESIVSLAYENVNQVYKSKFGVVISQGAFTDLIVCLTEFSKNMRFQKKSLQALEALKSIIPRLLKTPECPLSRNFDSLAANAEVALKSPSMQLQQGRTSVEEGYWFPVLFAFHDILMTGEDLEVRSSALEYFFDTLQKYGGDFAPEFWDILWRQQLEPIFMVLRSRPELNNALNHEELSVWLSTTMIQALRNMIGLFTHFFGALEYMLDRILKLLALCICQENDTIARIGSNCLQQLILKNRTTAKELFFATTLDAATTLSPVSNGHIFPGALSPAREDVDSKSLKINGGNDEASEASSSPAQTPKTARSTLAVDEESSASAVGASVSHVPLEDYKPSPALQQQPVVVTSARRRFFNRIISRCVLHLLMIETVNELFSNEAVYVQIPSIELLRLMALLKKSYLFARRFNNDKELRMQLWRQGFMGQPPNLLKQESGSAATYISILFRMFADTSAEREASRSDIEAALVPLCKDVIGSYITLEEESQHRNIVAWRPVVVDVLEGFASFPEPAFRENLPGFYPLIIELVTRELNTELRTALLLVLRRVGAVGLGIKDMSTKKERRESVTLGSGNGNGAEVDAAERMRRPVSRDA